MTFFGEIFKKCLNRLSSFLGVHYRAKRGRSFGSNLFPKGLQGAGQSPANANKALKGARGENKSFPPRDRRKSPVGTFPPKHPHCPHSLPAKPSVRTVVRIEVFFAPAKLGQKMDFKSPLRGQIIVFRQAEGGEQEFPPHCFILFIRTK